jgi:hypothetical protein
VREKREQRKEMRDERICCPLILHCQFVEVTTGRGVHFERRRMPWLLDLDLVVKRGGQKVWRDQGEVLH